MKKKIAITFCLYLMHMFLLEVTCASAQNAELEYSIMMNGSGVGLMTIQKTCSPDRTQLSLESKAKKRLLFLLKFMKRIQKFFKTMS